MKRTILGCAALLIAGAGCASSAGGGAPGTQETGAGGAGAQETGAGGAGGAAAGAPSCAAYHDVAGAGSVSIRVTNQRSTSVSVATVCNTPFDVLVGGVAHPGSMISLQYTCEQAKTERVPCCDCSSGGSAIAPGATWEATWDGLFYDTTQMPTACYYQGPEPGAPPPYPCVQPVAAAPGPMTLRANLFATSGSGTQIVPVEKDFVFGTDSVVEIVVQ